VSHPAVDREPLLAPGGASDWLVSWHPPDEEPAGRNHGSTGICVTDSGQVVLIGHDGTRWGLPGGRPEGDETYEETLRREMDEEACVDVVRARLLGFMRSECMRGPELGLVLVRAAWRAEVRVLPFQARFEIPLRHIVAASDALAYVEEGLTEAERRVLRRAFAEAELLQA
jgi:ADP-ribose pyrophosphatase YjhB (NUDIX family)